MKAYKYILAFGLMATLYSCGDDSIVVDDCQISYQDDLVPLVTTACDGYCHTSSNHFATYSNIKEVVDNGLLWQKVVIDQTMPLYGSGKSITDAQIEMFACWIEAGGPNN